MGVDGKYGKVTVEHGDIGEDEPVIVFRARDMAVPPLLDWYFGYCEELGSPERHLDLVNATYWTMKKWQEANPDKVRVPTSESSREWMSNGDTPEREVPHSGEG